MLTRLKVNGFKNLVDVDVRFGPFTCIAGANGVGKSNLFDAIRFLSALAEKSLDGAALSIRGEGRHFSDIRNLYHQVGDDYLDEMSFEAEMIVPKYGVDDFGRKVEGETSFLRYALTLTYHERNIRIAREELRSIKIDELNHSILFDPSTEWRDSAIKAFEESSTPILTKLSDIGKIKFLVEHGSKEKPESLDFLAEDIISTVLSLPFASENAAKVLARREMQSWRVLQLEPSAMRKVNSIDPKQRLGSQRLGADGSYLAATLYRVAHSWPSAAEPDPEWAYAQIAGRLYELLEDVVKIWVERDDKREEFTLYLQDRSGATFSGRQLSDGTLRMIALATLELDTQEQGLICIEEPENGVHPRRIPSMIDVLRGIAVDTDYAVGEDNPLRQVIVNTHSPEVVQQVPDDSLLIAELRENIREGKRFKSAKFSCLSDTWRTKAPESEVAVRGDLLVYLNPVIRQLEEDEKTHFKAQRVVDRPDVQRLLPETTE